MVQTEAFVMCHADVINYIYLFQVQLVFKTYIGKVKSYMVTSCQHMLFLSPVTELNTKLGP